MMDEKKKELVESEIDKVTGGKFPRHSPEEDLSDEDLKKLRELEKEIANRM